jgi:DNA-binding SARP family transcriptional activator
MPRRRRGCEIDALPRFVLRVRCLGSLAFFGANGWFSGPSPKRGRELLAYLLTFRKSPAPRTAIAEAIWPQLEADAVRQRLHLAVSGARGALRLAGAHDDAIQFRAGSYMWHSSVEIDSDFDRFVRFAAEGTAESARAAVALYAGEYMAGEQGDWLAPMRARCASTYIDLLEKLAADAIERGRYDLAQGYCFDLLTVDRGHEGAVRLLMSCYSALGRRSAALHEYATLSRYLADELGVEPARETTACVRRIAADDVRPHDQLVARA